MDTTNYTGVEKLPLVTIAEQAARIVRLERAWGVVIEERNRLASQVRAYRDTVILTGTHRLMALTDGDPVEFPTPESLATLLDEVIELRAHARAVSGGTR